jgi:hypothetical protein
MTLFAYIKDGTVLGTAIAETMPAPLEGFEIVEGPEGTVVLMTYEGGVFGPAPSPAPPSVAEYQAAIQATIDEAAISKQFNDGVTLASYVTSTIAAWADQAKAFVAWRDEIWTYVYAQLALVQAGTRAQPTVAGFLSELPAITWPADTP